MTRLNVEPLSFAATIWSAPNIVEFIVAHEDKVRRNFLIPSRLLGRAVPRTDDMRTMLDDIDRVEPTTRSKRIRYEETVRVRVQEYMAHGNRRMRI